MPSNHPRWSDEWLDPFFRGRFSQRKTTLAERFWSKVQKGEGCWIWTAGRTLGGYGRFWTGRYTVGAHRISWEMKYGPIPDGLNGLHRCDKPPCCNPDHLWLGTEKDNARDRDNKGHEWRPVLRGESNPRATLTKRDIEMIRASTFSGVELTRLVGVVSSTISAIKSRKTWAHVP